MSILVTGIAELTTNDLARGDAGSDPGDRSAEFAARMTGTPYDGGGIAVSVAATRAAADDELRRHEAAQLVVGGRARR